VINKKKVCFYKTNWVQLYKIRRWELGGVRKVFSRGRSWAINTLNYSKQKIIINIIDEQGRKVKLVLISAYQQEWRLDIS
jgi:hypothetical protein